MSEDPVNLTPDTRPVDILFILQSPGKWQIDRSNGIRIKGSGWSEHPVSGTQTQFTARSNSKDGMYVKYTINLENDGTTAAWDPFIWNN